MSTLFGTVMAAPLQVPAPTPLQQGQGLLAARQGALLAAGEARRRMQCEGMKSVAPVPVRAFNAFCTPVVESLVPVQSTPAVASTRTGLAGGHEMALPDGWAWTLAATSRRASARHRI